MNKVTNQSGIEIPAFGAPNSHIRNKTEFNLTFEKLIEVYKRKPKRMILELYDIMDADGIPEDRERDLIEAAYFYYCQETNTNEHDNT